MSSGKGRTGRRREDEGGTGDDRGVCGWGGGQRGSVREEEDGKRVRTSGGCGQAGVGAGRRIIPPRCLPPAALPAAFSYAGSGG